ncbi:hypothetical protein [Winogradskyella sp.]|uniref:hypothetical protein n=1 Tax=Winogradskyella sp. TaxID=1883156 RepID=UPI00261C68B6|nr:hypothetical protein [Winogradskyella sp.]
MEFLSDGTMITRLSIGTKKCGNDRSSNLSIGGNWNVDKRNNILSLTNGKFNSTEYRILASSSNKLIIKRIIAEEKL